MTETIDYMHRRFRISRAISRLSAVTFFRIVLRLPLLSFRIPFYLSLRFFLVFVLLIIDSRARRVAPSTSFSRCNEAEATRARRTRYQFHPHLASPRLHVALFFISPRGQTSLALHLLITNDKFALRLHRRDRTEANSHRRKCARGRCILPPPPPLRPSRSPSFRTLKIYQRMLHFTRVNLIR